MEQVKKTVDFPKDLAINIQAMATIEDRSFNAQVRHLIKLGMESKTLKN